MYQVLKIVVTVADDQLSLAIGKGGQNARLAAKLSGWKIDLVSKSERDRAREMEERARIDVDALESAGPKLQEKLIRAGIETVQDLLKAPREEILSIPGVGEKTAEKLIEEARELQERRNRQLAADAEAARAAAEAAAEAAGVSPQAAEEPAGTPAEPVDSGAAPEATSPEAAETTPEG